MGVVCRRTGLKPDLLRAWEKRFGVVRPVRSSGNLRLYSDADIEKLQLLHRAIRGGRRIGQIVALTPEELALVDAIPEDPLPAVEMFNTKLAGDYDRALRDSKLDSWETYLGRWSYTFFRGHADGRKRGIGRHKAAILAHILNYHGIRAEVLGDNAHSWVYLPDFDLAADPTAGTLTPAAEYNAAVKNPDEIDPSGPGWFTGHTPWRG